MGMTDVSICSCRSSSAVTVLALRQTQSYLAVFNKSKLTNETTGVLENLRRGCETLGYGELIQFLQCHFNGTVSRKLLSNLDCVAFS